MNIFTSRLLVFAFLGINFSLPAWAQNLAPQTFQTLNGPDWSFRENKGQLFDENHKPLNDIPYYGRNGGVNIYCKAGEISFVFVKTENDKQVSEATGSVETPIYGVSAAYQRRDKSPSLQKSATATRADLILLGSNPNAEIFASGTQSYYENYYTTGDANHGITNVHTYKTVTYKDIYPNIDMVLEAKPNSLEYSFIVHPGGNVADIQLQWNGLDNIKQLENGGIAYSLPNFTTSLREGPTESSLTTAVGGLTRNPLDNTTPAPTFTETPPVCYQPTTGDYRFFQKNGNLPTPTPENTTYIGSMLTPSPSGRAGEGRVLSFQISPYDHSRTLIIDPTLDWGTYYGGSGLDEGTGITHDNKGNVYVTGYTTSINRIATSGAYQTVIGDTTNGDAFVAKFNSLGNLIWGTYYGGNEVDWGLGITTDANNNIYITGFTGSASGIATSGTHQTSLAGNENAFVAKFTFSGSLIWGTYYGGSGGEQGNAISLDANDNIYITGNTSSDSGIATSGAYQTSYMGRQPYGRDIFTAKFSPFGKLLWGTYLGGEGDNEGNAITTDTNNNVYITGFTTSQTGIATSGAYNTKPSSVFLVKFTSSGSLAWGTYYGATYSAGSGYGNGITTDANNNIYLTGFTESKSGFATSGAYKTIGDSIHGDVFLAKFNSSGSLAWGTYYGGSGSDIGYGVTTDAASNAYITGCTTSTSDIATSDAYQTKFAGDNFDAFIAKFTTSGSLAWGTYYGGDSFYIPKNVEEVANSAQSITVVANNNVYITGYTISRNGIATSGAYQTNLIGGVEGINAFVAKFSPCHLNTKITNGSLAVCAGSSASYTARKDTGSTYLWSVIGGIISSGQNSDTANITWGSGDTGYVKVLETNGFCTDSAIDTVIIYPFPLINAGNDTTICAGNRIGIGSAPISGNSYSWSSNPPGFSSTIFNPSISPTITTTYYLTETVKNTGCSKTDSVVITVNPLPAANTGATKAVCVGYAARIGAAPVSGNTYSWTSKPAGFTADTSDVLIIPKANGTYYLTETITATGCSKTNSVIVYLDPPAITGPNSAICTGQSIQLGATPIGDDEYSWIASDTSGVIDTISNPKVSPTATTTYFLTETIREGGCSKTNSVVITVNPLPLAKTIKSQAICYGKVISIGDTAVSGDAYIWSSNPTGLLSTNSNPSVNPIANTTYFLTETITATGCNKSGSVLITVKPLPVANAGINQAICTGSSGTIGTSGTNGDSYLWTSKPVRFTSTGATEMVAPTVTTTYYLTATNTCGSKTDSVVITLNPLPDAHWSANVDFGKASFTPDNTNSKSYLWRFGDSLSKSDSSILKSPVYTYKNNGKYMVSLTITDANGCTNEYDSDIVVSDAGGFVQLYNLKIYPNPFANNITISYSLPVSQNVEITLNDELGKYITAIANEYQSPGNYTYTIDGDRYSLAAAVYFLRFIPGSEAVEVKIVRLR